MKELEEDNDEEVSKQAFKQLYPQSDLEFKKVIDYPYLVQWEEEKKKKAMNASASTHLSADKAKSSS